MLVHAFRQLTARAPDATEQKILARLFDEQLAHFSAHPAAATAHLAIGDTAPDPTLPAPALAALATLVNTLMNHDAFAVKR